MGFVHLHLHTEYSLLDGAVRIMKGKKSFPLVEAVKDLGMTAVAMTDHGNMYGAVAFAKSLKDSNTGVKGIFGCEFYTAEDMFDKSSRERDYNHLILLAKNDVGYHNLMKLSSASFLDGFYYKPRIDLTLLRKHSEGLICMSACLAGRIPQYLLHDKYDDARNYALELQKIFGEDFYIELMDHGIPEEKLVFPRLIKIAREIGAKVVATNDVHYLRKEDADFQDTMMRITLRKKKNEVSSMCFLDYPEFYLKSEEEMLEVFKDCPEAVENTVEVANKCTFDFMVKSDKYYIPEFDANAEEYQCLVRGMNPKYLPRIEKQYDVLQAAEDAKGTGVVIDRTRDNKATYFRRLAYTMIEDRYKEITKEIDERMEYELDTIISLGYDSYYLVVWDFINFAKRTGVPVGPGRGSGAGSIVAYAIHITDIDPIRFRLIFERFLNKERVSMPDFDIDFCENRRSEVIKYVVRRYGAKNVSQIIAYSTMSAKAVVKDVARVYDIPYNEVNDWVKTIPAMLGENKSDLLSCLGKNKIDKETGQCFRAPEFIKLYEENPLAKQIIDIAIMLEGMPRQASVHAAGVVICSEDITDHCPLQKSGTDITTQFDKTQIEDLGLLKMDFLGLTTLTDIASALELIKKRGITVDFDALGDDDPKVYEMIASGDTEAVFQLESGGMTSFMTQLRPSNLEEITAGIAIYRPGPMDFRFDYIDGKNDPSNISYLVPELEPYLSVTNGIIVYQEQVMDIARGLAGFSYGGADILRRAMGKKDAHIMETNRKLFVYGREAYDEVDKHTGKIVHYDAVDGAVKRGIPEDKAIALYGQIQKFASYAFNKSHAAAYSTLTYRTAYLKCYYMLEFFTAVINNRLSKPDKVKRYMSYLKKRGYKILQPDINRSEVRFSIEDGCMRFGLMGTKNVGEAALIAILDDRKKKGQFKSLYDFIERASALVVPVIDEDGREKTKGSVLNKRMVECLIKGGAFDCFGMTRASMLACYEQIMDIVQKDAKSKSIGQMSLFDLDEVAAVYDYPLIPEMDKAHLLSFEREVLGLYISGHPLDELALEFNGFTTRGLLSLDDDTEDEESYADDYSVEDDDEQPSVRYNMELNGQTVTMGVIVQDVSQGFSKKNNRLYARGTIEDMDGAMGFMVTGDTASRLLPVLKSGVPLLVKGQLSLKRDEQPTLFLSDATPWTGRGVVQAEQTARNEPSPAAEQNDLWIVIKDFDEACSLVPVLRSYPGKALVFGKYPSGEIKKFRMTVRLCSDLIFDLSDRLGRRNVEERPHSEAPTDA